MSILLHVCNFLISLFGLLYAYRTLYLLIGLFRTKKFAPAQNLHRYAILIAARNEDTVIGNLLDSIARQDYPAEYRSVFVVADNCTDQTAAVTRARGAVCYERFDTKHVTKGYALQYLLEQIARDYGPDAFEGYFIFDADNLLKRDFISRMNDAFDAGETVVTAYRNSKNPDANCLAAGYALHWLRTARFESRARSALGVSTWVQGCGFLFAASLVRDGWHYTSLTEDRAFSVDAILSGHRISYQHEAEFYDEQPTDLRIVMRQRIRWVKGHLEAFRDYAGNLLREIFAGQATFRRKWICYDMLMTILPYSVIFIPLKLLKFAASAALILQNAALSAVWHMLIGEFFTLLIYEHFAVIPAAVLLFILERHRLPSVRWQRVLLFSLTFPLFGIIGDIATWIALFTRVTWKPIPHGADIRIEEIEKQLTVN